MNKFVMSLFFCFFACQTLADEVEIRKQDSPSSDKMPEPQKKQMLEEFANITGLSEGMKIRQVRSLDPAIFTMIRPFTVDSSPVKLPDEQIFD